MRPQEAGPWRKELRRAARGIPGPRRATREIATTFGRRQAAAARLAEFQQYCQQRRLEGAQ